MGLIVILLPIIAALVICITAIASPQLRLRLWGWIFPVAILAALTSGLAIGVGLALAAFSLELLPPCDDTYCDLGQVFYIIAAIVVLMLLSTIVLLSVFGKKVAVHAKTHRMLWIVFTALLALPALVVFTFFVLSNTATL